MFILHISELVWSQEEHRNQGAWSFIAPRFEHIIGRKVPVIILNILLCVVEVGACPHS